MSAVLPKLWTHRYRLRARARLGARAESLEREGALLMVETPDWRGFCDVHPWVQFGDASLDAQIESLAEGRPLPLAQRSLEHARRDGEARAADRSAFAGFDVPYSHWLVSDLASVSIEDVRGALRKKFKSIKAKVGRDWTEESLALSALAPVLGEFGARLRLDFNSSLSKNEFAQAWAALSVETRPLIEFVEDPCPWSERDWAELSAAGIPVAYDQPKGGDGGFVQGSFRTRVLKPAAQDALAISWKLDPGVAVAVTSYLDHPVGQASAALEAGLIERDFSVRGSSRRLVDCGLLSHFAYEPNAFSEALSSDGPVWRAPGGKGLGFDELLERLEWRPLA